MKTKPLYAIIFDKASRSCILLTYEVTPQGVIQRKDEGKIKVFGRLTDQGPQPLGGTTEPCEVWVHHIQMSSVYWTEDEKRAIDMITGVKLGIGCELPNFFVGFGPPKPASDRPQGPSVEESVRHGE